MKRLTKGYGSFPKPIQKRFAKTTKKTVLKLKCKECDHIIQSKSMRLKKVEVQKVQGDYYAKRRDCSTTKLTVLKGKMP